MPVEESFESLRKADVKKDYIFSHMSGPLYNSRFFLSVKGLGWRQKVGS